MDCEGGCYFVVGIHTEKRWTPTQNSAQMLRLMKSHTYQGCMKDFIIPLVRLSRESRAAPKQVQKWPERTERGDWLGGFMVVRGLGQGDGSACSLNFPQVAKQKAARLYCTNVGQKGRKEWGKA